MSSKLRMMFMLATAELLGMSVWLSASAVVSPLTDEWNLSGSGQSWLTMSVQVGFVCGALFSAIFNLADRLPTRWLFSGSAALAALCTGLIPALAEGPELALPLRFATGFLLAGVYPVGMKIMSTWTKEDRGLGIGLIVGALTIGTAMPHLLGAVTTLEAWRTALYLAALLGLSGAVIAGLFVREGPYAAPTPRFNWKYVGDIVRDRNLTRANLGYLGHMWELYAMWVWVPVFVIASFEESGHSTVIGGIVAFSVIAVGGVGSIAAGAVADRIGRTTITIASLSISGTCALFAGLMFGVHPLLLVPLLLIWGLAVVADSAQFSACITELSAREYMGTALTLQTSIGFLLTLLTIRLVPVIEDAVGWGIAFGFLALGPAVGIVSMMSLRRSPAALQLASGNK